MEVNMPPPIHSNNPPAIGLDHIEIEGVGHEEEYNFDQQQQNQPAQKNVDPVPGMNKMSSVDLEDPYQNDDSKNNIQQQ